MCRKKMIIFYKQVFLFGIFVSVIETVSVHIHVLAVYDIVIYNFKQLCKDCFIILGSE